MMHTIKLGVEILPTHYFDKENPDGILEIRETETNQLKFILTIDHEQKVFIVNKNQIAQAINLFGG